MVSFRWSFGQVIFILTNVSFYDITKFERDCYGSEQGEEWNSWQNQNITNAYILIYEKVKKKPIELIFPDVCSLKSDLRNY